MTFLEYLQSIFPQTANRPMADRRFIPDRFADPFPGPAPDMRGQMRGGVSDAIPGPPHPFGQLPDNRGITRAREVSNGRPFTGTDPRRGRP